MQPLLPKLGEEHPGWLCQHSASQGSQWEMKEVAHRSVHQDNGTQGGARLQGSSSSTWPHCEDGRPLGADNLGFPMMSYRFSDFQV